jgi:hypothetical protein
MNNLIKKQRKFNTGDDVVYIKPNMGLSFEISNDTIGTVSIKGDEVMYWLENDDYCEVEEKDLYTKIEALDFLKEVLI